MKIIQNIKLIILSLLSFTVVFFMACTNLDVEVRDSALIEDEEGTFIGVNPTAALESSYGDLRQWGDQANIYALMEVTSDEQLVPTRGTDWGDNGVWRTLHQHTWDATHQYVLNTWNNLNSNVFRLNQLIDPRSNANPQQLAEARFLRAFNMFHVLDLYGQIPFREPDEGADVDPRVFRGQEAFDFVLNDIEAALPNLPVLGPSLQTIRASRAAGNMLLAKLLLQKHIILGGEPVAADMTRVIQLVDEITADGFALHPEYFDIFKAEQDSETILYTDAEVGNRIWNGLHYHQIAPDNTGGGWNGFTTTADFYALFEGDPDNNHPGANQEQRRGFVPTDGSHLGIGYGFLFGQQYGPNGQQLTDRIGNPLFYTKEFPGLAGNNERTGIRVIKYHPENGSFRRHLIMFRYADAYLMKIEAILRGGTSSDNPTTLLNQLRTVRGASPLANVNLNTVLDERGRELYVEGWRRMDQIRFGTFTGTWPMKTNTESHRVLFPIPALAVATNPNLEQNPGY
jgi:starch-binding outer membrane protein, SusD/RagB family